MALSSKHAGNIARASLVVSIVFFVISLLIGQWTRFFVVYAAGWQLLAAALIWFVLAVQFHQRALAEQEKLDIAQLQKDRDSSTIFQGTQQQNEIFNVARDRLKALEKWFVPISAAVIAIYEIVIGLHLLNVMKRGIDFEPTQPLVAMVAMAAIALVCFLMSRYATGMAGEIAWKPLRAGGSFFLGITMTCFLSAVGLALSFFKIPGFVNFLGWIISLLIFILGLETGINVVLDIFRPRLQGQYPRSAFDSRLLGVINEPGQIIHTAASAVDYQFGFKVSQTWFYKLLEKAIVPLILFACIVLYLSSMFVIVGPGQKAVIEHFGNPLCVDGKARIAEPGLTVKWPWPIDKAYKYSTDRVAEVAVGYVEDEQIDPRTGKPKKRNLLWGTPHYKEEYSLLVASENVGQELTEGAAPVSLVIAAVPVQYRIKDLYSFVYKHNDPEQVLEYICYREVTKFAASAKIEPDEHGGNQSLLGAGRAKAQAELTKRIQASADAEELGVEILLVGLQGVHPPVDVAKDYQKVIGAVQQKQANILSHLAMRNQLLSNLVGGVEQADELYTLAEQYIAAENKGDEAAVDQLGKKLDAAYEDARGEVFKTLSQAKGQAYKKSTLSKATGQRFAGQLKAYYADKEIYKHHQRLLMFEEALENIRKYVVAADTNDTQVYIFNMQEKLEPSLYDITGLEEEQGK